MGDDSYVPIVALALGVAFYAWVALKPEFLTRSAPLTLGQRMRAQVAVRWRS
jgi:hypothetical protein